jgi:hypothetical protein
VLFLNQEQLAEIGLTPYKKVSEGYQIDFSALESLAEGVLGCTIDEAVRDPLSAGYQDNIRQFWSQHVDEYASESETECFCFFVFLDDMKGQLQHYFGDDWSYVPVTELTQEQIAVIKGDNWWDNYLYYPVFEAIVKGLGDFAKKKVYVYYDF